MHSEKGAGWRMQKTGREQEYGWIRGIARERNEGENQLRQKGHEATPRTPTAFQAASGP